MRMRRRAETGQGCYLMPFNFCDGRDARARRLAVNEDRAGTALRETATEARILQAELVAQCVEQRRCGIGLDGLRLAVDPQPDRLVHNIYLASRLAKWGFANPDAVPMLLGRCAFPGLDVHVDDVLVAGPANRADSEVDLIEAVAVRECLLDREAMRRQLLERKLAR